MQFFALSRISLLKLSVCTVPTILSGCSTPLRLSFYESIHSEPNIPRYAP